jgi:hypothetical protein
VTQRGLDPIACAEIARPVEEVRDRCGVTFLLSETPSGIDANAQRVNSSRRSSINSSPERLTPNPEKIDHSPTIQKDSNHTKQAPPSGSAIVLSKDQWSALTDNQCRKIQEIIDPDDIRKQKSWEFNSQPKLIRLYMSGISFPQIEAEMKPLVDWL